MGNHRKSIGNPQENLETHAWKLLETCLRNSHRNEWQFHTEVAPPNDPTCNELPENSQTFRLGLLWGGILGVAVVRWGHVVRLEQSS